MANLIDINTDVEQLHQRILPVFKRKKYVVSNTTNTALSSPLLFF